MLASQEYNFVARCRRKDASDERDCARRYYGMDVRRDVRQFHAIAAPRVAVDVGRAVISSNAFRAAFARNMVCAAKRTGVAYRVA